MHQAKACFWKKLLYMHCVHAAIHPCWFPTASFYFLSWPVLGLNLSYVSLRKRWLFCFFVWEFQCFGLFFRQEGSVFNTHLCFIWFYFLSGFGRVKGTVNFKLLEVLTERIWSLVGLLFFSLSHWHGLNWCEASSLPLLNLSRSWRISLLQSALEAWYIESVMTILMVNFCTLWVSVIRAFNV